MATKLKNLVIDRIGFVDRGANQEAMIALAKRATQESKMPDEKPDELAVAKAELAKVQAELAALQKGEDTTPADLATARKAYAEVVKERDRNRAEMQQEIEKAHADAEEARTEVIKIRAARRREQFIKRAQELQNLPGAPADDFAEILDAVELGLQKVAPDKAAKMFAKVNTLLTSWNAIVGKSKIFEELGSTEIGAFTGAEGTLQAMAKARAEQDKSSIEIAYKKVLDENPTLYKRYLAEKKGS